MSEVRSKLASQRLKNALELTDKTAVRNKIVKLLSISTYLFHLITPHYFVISYKLHTNPSLILWAVSWYTEDCCVSALLAKTKTATSHNWCSLVFNVPLCLSESISILLSLLLRTSPRLTALDAIAITTEPLATTCMSRCDRQTGDESPLRDRWRTDATRDTGARTPADTSITLRFTNEWLQA